MTRTAGAPMGCQRPSRFWGLGCPKIFHEAEDTLVNQYSTLWVTYRATAERLKHEKYLFLSVAGPYKELTESERLIVLAERIEEHVSTEHANWSNETRRVMMAQKKEGA
ncbi:DUF4231 domain-containing protein [Thiolapillus sp.]|uniref:DUF4231 domain-containing protein n=1 Tax=Thiolapillus sp. TaxID=2017437 RepID=UPI003AF9B7FC